MVECPELAPLVRRKRFGGLSLRWVAAFSVAAALCAVGSAAVSGSSTEHRAVRNRCKGKREPGGPDGRLQSIVVLEWELGWPFCFE